MKRPVDHSQARINVASRDRAASELRRAAKNAGLWPHEVKATP